MSYLLTEIALEMLGYKFYDIYGIQDEINNFQNHASNDRAAGEQIPNERNLTNLLGINTAAAGTTESERKRNKETFEEINANLPEPLTKLMDTEYNKVRQQILRNKPAAAEPQNDPKAVHTVVQSFIETEHEKLRLEQQNLRHFRKIVEQNLLQMNPATFEKYCQVFKTDRKQIKRLDTNK